MLQSESTLTLKNSKHQIRTLYYKNVTCNYSQT